MEPGTYFKEISPELEEFILEEQKNDPELLKSLGMTEKVTYIGDYYQICTFLVRYGVKNRLNKDSRKIYPNEKMKKLYIETDEEINVFNQLKFLRHHFIRRISFTKYKAIRNMEL